MAALARRRRAPSPPGGGSCQTEPEPPFSDDSFTFLHANVRGFMAHRTDLNIFCKLADLPGLVALNETLPDESVQTINMEGYALVSRLDRKSENMGGGICLFARNDLSGSVAHIADSDGFERSWHILHTDHGPILFGTWYRPPKYGETESIAALRDEWLKYSKQSVGTIIIGDMNVHNKGWLKHSSRNTPEGRLLASFCTNHGFKQLVRRPTRGSYLLDLVLSNLTNDSTVKILPRISDHNAILLTVPLPMPVSKPSSRM